MRPYFEKMADIGKPLPDSKIRDGEANVARIREIEIEIEREVEKKRSAGLPEKKINDRGQLTVFQRLERLVDPGTWHPLHSIFNPEDNEEGSTGVVDGLGKINGKWAVIIGFDNKVMAGAWVPGQAANILRVTDLAKRFRLPLVWLVNCFWRKTHRATGSIS